MTDKEDVVIMPNGVMVTGYTNYDPDFKSTAHYLKWSYGSWGKKIFRSFKWHISQKLKSLMGLSR